MANGSGRAPSGQALVSDHAAVGVDAPSGFDPSREWQRLYACLLSMRPDGKLDNEGSAFDLILAGFIESREVKKPCRNCGTPLLDYRFNRITWAGRLFMAVCAIATEAGTAETPQSGSVHEGAGPQDIAKTASPKGQDQ